VVVALENHGDLLDTGQQIIDFIRVINSPAVRVNYDTGNAWYYSKGTVNPVAEMNELSPVIAHVHLKSPEVNDGLLRWVALGEGMLNIEAAADVLKRRLPGVPVSYELSPRQRARAFEPRWRTPEVPPLDQLRATIGASLTVLGRVLA